MALLKVRFLEEFSFLFFAPSLTIITVLTFIGAFEWFDLPFVLGGSNGSPAGATDTLALMFYRLSFGSVDSGANNVGVVQLWELSYHDCWIRSGARV